MGRIAPVALAVALAVVLGTAQAAHAEQAPVQVGWKLRHELTLDKEYQSSTVDPETASRDGYYYQIKGPAVAVSGSVVLVAWEYWLRQTQGVYAQGVYGVELTAVDANTGSILGKHLISIYDPKKGQYVLFGPALVSYGRGEFLLAVPEVNIDYYFNHDYGDLCVYRVTVDAQNKRITVDTKALKVASNAAYPHLVYLGEDKNGNRYVAVVYEAWNPKTGKGDVVLQVLKIDTSGNLSVVLSNPVVIAQDVCKKYVSGIPYFGHARPVASVYEEGGKKYLIVALTDYSNAKPYISDWGYFNEWWGCRVRAFVIELPSDLSTLGSARLSPVEVQGRLTSLGAVDTTSGSSPVQKPPTNEAAWVADNVIVYRAAPLWGGMNTQVPDIYAALIVHENGRWVFKYDRCICNLIFTQTNPCVVRLFDSGGDRYYLVVFSDNSGGFGKERIYSVLLKVSGNGVSVLGEHPVTDYGNDPVPYYWCPVAATVREGPGSRALVAIAFYRGDTGWGARGHRAGDVILQLVEVSVATQQAQQGQQQQGGGGQQGSQQQQGGGQQGGQQGQQSQQQGQQGSQQQQGGQQGQQQQGGRQQQGGQQSRQGQQGGQQQQQSQQTGQQGGQQGGQQQQGQQGGQQQGGQQQQTGQTGQQQQGGQQQGGQQGSQRGGGKTGQQQGGRQGQQGQQQQQGGQQQGQQQQQRQGRRSEQQGAQQGGQQERQGRQQGRQAQQRKGARQPPQLWQGKLEIPVLSVLALAVLAVPALRRR